MELKFILESILFTSQKPLSIRELREILSTAAEKAEDETAKPFKKTKEEEITQVLEQLEKEHTESGRSYYLACVAGSWQFVARPEYMPWLKVLFGVKTRPPRLSQPALETLAIVAYRQPITRAEIEQIRGVAVDGVVATLLERGLIENAGRAEVVGRPMTYTTTILFLEYFGLRNLDELPSADELRRIPVEKPESLLTVEAGLATATPQDLQAAPQSGAAAPSAPSPEPGTAPEVEETRTESSASSPESSSAPRTESSAGSEPQPPPL
jgi:segregation and condensation protein B